jgi:hypothetical protein
LRIINPVTGAYEERRPSIRIGEEYVVLEVAASPGREVRLRLHLTSEVPSLWSSAMFETVDQSIPSNWVVDVANGGHMSMGPASWLEGGFWESYFDGEQPAVAVFEQELATILAES